MGAEVGVLERGHPVLAQHVLPGAVKQQDEDGERPVRDRCAMKRSSAFPIHPLKRKLQSPHSGRVMTRKAQGIDSTDPTESQF